MSPGNGAKKPRGRTEGEIRHAAVRVRIRDAIRDYRGKSGLPGGFSYSLETRMPYDANRPEDRAALLEHYGDGRSPVYVIAVTNEKEAISDEHAAVAAADCASGGFVPFLGRWLSRGAVYEDVSVAIDHGMADEGAMALLRVLGQKAGLRVTRDECRLLYNPDCRD